MKNYLRRYTGKFLWAGLLMAGCLILPLLWSCMPSEPWQRGQKQPKGTVDTGEDIGAKLAVPADTDSGEETDEELWQDLYVSACMPAILQAVEEAYGAPLLVDPWDVSVLRAERTEGYRSFCFLVEVEITPYDGPHIILGRDRLILESDGTGCIEVAGFRHIESFSLPEENEGAPA